jgi:NAD(P)-dependent dehydrogenase (short-subunit alcohol dehydrogenase family)
MKLDDKVFVVTGGASGLGYGSTVMALSRYKDTKVAVLDFSEGLLGPVIEKYKNRVLFIKTDITSDEQVKKAFEEIIKNFGQVNILINSAGIGTPSKLLQKNTNPQNLSTFQKVIDVNLTGTINVIRWFAHHVVAYAKANNIPLVAPQREGELESDGVNTESLGSIINVASVAAFDGQVGQTAYSASKGGVVSFTLPLARELSQSRIRVNTIAPGVFLTPMMKGLPQKAQDSLAKQVPFPNRLGDEAEFAHCVMFLCENEYMNGNVMRIDGAMRMAAM